MSDSRFDALDRRAHDVYGAAGHRTWILKFCQQIVAVCAEGRRLERAYAQACTNLATIRPSHIERATIGDDADRYHDALLAGWGGIEGWDEHVAAAENSQQGHRA